MIEENLGHSANLQSTKNTGLFLLKVHDVVRFVLSADDDVYGGT